MDINNTRKKILASAKSLFLVKGYEHTNLREICSGAGVTVGAFYNYFKNKEALFSALVQPCIDGLYKIYNRSKEECFEQLTSDELMKIWEISSNTIIGFVDYIYEYFDTFKLLIMCSDGTPYHNFVEDLVAVEVDGSLIFFKELIKRGIDIPIIPKNVIHMLSHCYFSSIFECVVHNYSKDQALDSIKYLVPFFNTGWKNILNFYI